MRALTLIVCGLLITGCDLADQRSTSQTVEVERRTGQEGGYPLDVLVQRSAHTTAQAQISSPVLTQAAQGAGGLLGLLSGGAGAAGLAGLALAWLKHREARSEADYGDGERQRAETSEAKLRRALARLPPDQAKDLA